MEVTIQVLVSIPSTSGNCLGLAALTGGCWIAKKTFPSLLHQGTVSDIDALSSADKGYMQFPSLLHQGTVSDLMPFFTAQFNPCFHPFYIRELSRTLDYDARSLLGTEFPSLLHQGTVSDEFFKQQFKVVNKFPSLLHQGTVSDDHVAR